MGIVKLKAVVEKFQKSLLLSPKRGGSYNCDKFGNPKDVKEGHFSVIAVDENELKRFVVPVSVLTQRWFMRLLEQAAEEYGFAYDGALTLPCRPSELERILQEQIGSRSSENKNL